jgi:hypothetical protein
MSKRISDERGRSVGRSALRTDVASARSLSRGLLFEVDALALIQLVEASLHRAAVKEPLLAAVVTNEPEPTITNESFDSAARHPSLLEHTRCAQARDINIRSTELLDEPFRFLDEPESSASVGDEIAYGCVQNGDWGLGVGYWGESGMGIGVNGDP